jgi:hypothetical protein
VRDVPTSRLQAFYTYEEGVSLLGGGGHASGPRLPNPVSDGVAHSFDPQSAAGRLFNYPFLWSQVACGDGAGFGPGRPVSLSPTLLQTRPAVATFQSFTPPLVRQGDSTQPRLTTSAMGGMTA